GVHALCTTAHADLCRDYSKENYTSDYLTTGINRYFQKAKIDIRIRKTLGVPSHFHSRFNASGRTYLYRLAVCKTESKLPIESLTPISEHQRLYVIRAPYFDVKIAKAACEIIKGTHDFKSFAGASSKREKRTIRTERSIDDLNITPGRPLLDPIHDTLYDNLEFLDVNVKAQSFLYKQVRRTVGVIVAAAQNKISLTDVEFMLNNPSIYSWNPRICTAPSHGLYLINVHYPETAFEEEASSQESNAKSQQELNEEFKPDTSFRYDPLLTTKGYKPGG
ncbi:unnamed protein product, partial [Meganyctiphanes norvegica]